MKTCTKQRSCFKGYGHLNTVVSLDFINENRIVYFVARWRHSCYKFLQYEVSKCIQNKTTCARIHAEWVYTFWRCEQSKIVAPVCGPPCICQSYIKPTVWTLLGHSISTSWRRGVVVSGVCCMNEVNAHWARLVLGRVTIFGQVYHLRM